MKRKTQNLKNNYGIIIPPKRDYHASRKRKQALLKFKSDLNLNSTSDFQKFH